MALLPHQEGHCAHLVKVLLEKGSALDASDTGTGKTYSAVHAAIRLGLPVGIVCPKAVIPSWERVCKAEGLKPAFILNYEKLSRGGSDFVFRNGQKFIWNFAGLVIWDEVQRCKSHASLNSKMLISAWETKLIRCLCLSATAAQNPLEMRALGFAINLHKNHNFWAWVFQNGAKRNRWKGFEWRGSPEQLEAIHKGIFPGRGARMRIKDAPEAFPENHIIAEPLEIGAPGELNAIYKDAERALKELKKKEDADFPSAMTIILRARQRAELLKVPTLVEMTEDLLEEGKSVCIFVNFNETLGLLSQHLDSGCTIHGQQTAEERQKNIDDFQNNKQRVLIANIQAGGVGISLHDTTGTAPRASLLAPTYNAVDLKQALGRIYRAGGKSPCIQRLVYAAGTVEEKVCARVQAKISNIELLNDGEITDELIWKK